MKYFITGATGFIGGRIARQLRKAGHQVIALVRSSNKAGELKKLGVQLAEGDITQKESMRTPMSGVDGVFHVAGWYKVGATDTSMAAAINVEGTRNVLELMKEMRIPKGVYTSTLAVHSDTRGAIVDESYRFSGKHISVYDETKWRAHFEIADPMQYAGLPLVIVHPGLVYGPGDESQVAHSLRQYLQRKLPVAPKRTAYCWAHVEDIAQGHILAMQKGKAGENYHICGPVVSFTDAMTLCEKITGIKGPSLHVTPALLRLTALFMSVAGKIIELPEQYRSESLRVIAGITYTGTDAKARRELGFATRPLEDGLRETLEHEMMKLGMRAA